MGTSDNELAFFREGLSRYAVARETVEYFEQRVLEAIFNAFETRSAWTHFQPVRKKGSLEFGKGKGNVFISACILGAVITRNIPKAWLGLSLNWNPPLVKGVGNAPVTAVAACHCNTTNADGLSTPVAFNEPASEGLISLGPLNRRREEPRFWLVASDTFDPDESFGLLLDAADAALGPLESGSTIAASVS